MTLSNKPFGNFTRHQRYQVFTVHKLLSESGSGIQTVVYYVFNDVPLPWYIVYAPDPE
jgi:hypothetical protein